MVRSQARSPSLRCVGPFLPPGTDESGVYGSRYRTMGRNRRTSPLRSGQEVTMPAVTQVRIENVTPTRLVDRVGRANPPGVVPARLPMAAR